MSSVDTPEQSFQAAGQVPGACKPTALPATQPTTDVGGTDSLQQFYAGDSTDEPRNYLVSPLLTVELCGESVSVLLDTGSQISCIGSSF